MKAGSRVDVWKFYCKSKKTVCAYVTLSEWGAPDEMEVVIVGNNRLQKPTFGDGDIQVAPPGGTSDMAGVCRSKKAGPISTLVAVSTRDSASTYELHFTCMGDAFKHLPDKSYRVKLLQDE